MQLQLKKTTKGLCAWVPTNLRRHHSDVVPGCVFSVQRLRGPYRATDFINPEVPFVILFTVQEISVGGDQDIHKTIEHAIKTEQT